MRQRSNFRAWVREIPFNLDYIGKCLWWGHFPILNPSTVFGFLLFFFVKKQEMLCFLLYFFPAPVCICIFSNHFCVWILNLGVVNEQQKTWELLSTFYHIWVHVFSGHWHCCCLPVDLLALLKWKAHPDRVMDILGRLRHVSGEEIVKVRFGCIHICNETTNAVTSHTCGMNHTIFLNPARKIETVVRIKEILNLKCVRDFMV